MADGEALSLPLALRERVRMANARTADVQIAARGVAYVSGGTTILDDIDMTVARGQRLFVIGPNGSGKSTLLRVLHGLIVPTRGTITWDGGSDRPANQAMVFQRPVLLRRSAAANVAYGLELAGVRGNARDRAVVAALAEVGLLEVANRPARVLSGGEQQRVALARAWALEPELLFLDEPTASLDPGAARAVEAVVRDIHARGTTIVMSTHNLAQAKRLAGDVIFMNRGRIVECTPAAEFFHRPVSAEAREFIEGERL